MRINKKYFQSHKDSRRQKRLEDLNEAYNAIKKVKEGDNTDGLDSNQMEKVFCLLKKDIIPIVAPTFSSSWLDLLKVKEETITDLKNSMSNNPTLVAALNKSAYNASFNSELTHNEIKDAILVKLNENTAAKKNNLSIIKFLRDFDSVELEED